MKLNPVSARAGKFKCAHEGRGVGPLQKGRYTHQKHGHYAALSADRTDNMTTKARRAAAAAGMAGIVAVVPLGSAFADWISGYRSTTPSSQTLPNFKIGGGDITTRTDVWDNNCQRSYYWRLRQVQLFQPDVTRSDGGGLGCYGQENKLRVSAPKGTYHYDHVYAIGGVTFYIDAVGNAY